MTNVFEVDQETLSKVFEKLNVPGTMGSKFFLDDVIQEFAAYNSEMVAYTLHYDFELIEPEDIIEFLDTAGTVYFRLEK